MNKINIDKTDTKLTSKQFEQMKSAVSTFKKRCGKNPTEVYITAGKPEYISWQKYQLMLARYNPKIGYIYITVPADPNKLSGLIRIPGFYPDRQDTDHTCADSSLQMLFSSYDLKEDEEDIAVYAGTTSSGTSHEGVEAAIKKINKLTQFNFEWNWDNLSDLELIGIAKLIKSGKRIMLHIMTGDSTGWRFPDYIGIHGHYIVLVGVNVDNNTALIADPDRNVKYVPWSDIQKACGAVSQKSVFELWK